MFTTSKLFKVLLVALVSLVITACDTSDVKKGQVLLTCDVPLIPDASGSSCIDPPPIDCPAPTVPDALNEKCAVGFNPNAPVATYYAKANEAVLYYNRSIVGVDNSGDTSSYDGFKLHLWNNAGCDAYAESEITTWSDGKSYDGIDPVYGAYYVIALKEGYGSCGNFILHEGDTKALGDGDLKMPLMQDDEVHQRMNFTFHSKPDIYEFPVESLGKQPLKISDISAHWIDANTVVWAVDELKNETLAELLPLAAKIQLHHSLTAGIAVDENDQLNGTVIELLPTDLTAEQKAAYPLVANELAYTFNASLDEVKSVLKNELVIAAYDESNIPFAATYVQADKVLDAIYTAADNDADEATLGVSYQGGEVSVSVWAPTAQSVNLKVFNAGKTETASHVMTENPTTGIWTFTGGNELDRGFYQFEVNVYHYQSHQVETLVVTDPYSISLSTNGEYSQFVNLNDADLMPAGWDSQTIPTITNPEDAVIYEGHIRDFSVLDDSTSAENRGKFLAFTETDSAPMMHLQKLADSGLTHFHMLPANDIASINENADTIVDVTDTIADLCAVNASAAVCGVESNDAVILDVLASYNEFSDEAADLVNAMRNTDSFNWGYDPKHFSVPDGIYASNPDGVARIVEMRSMIQALHETGLRAVLDVVYNHTNSAGLYDNSVFDKLVPGYYHSRDVITGKVLQSTCCNDTALEHRMMDKLMVDSLAIWTEHYKFDGFRFDIMSQGSKDQMLAARAAIQAIDEDNYFYGEGWYKDSRGFERADQENMAGTEISTYNDRLRDAVREAKFYSFEDDNSPFIQADLIKFGMAGTLADYVLKTYTGSDTEGRSATKSMYAKDPADIINYISKHDNESLWDQLQLALPYETMLDDRVRIQNASHGIILMSQGIPFLQMGGDFLRSKSLDRNTYDAGDWYNKVDFTLANNNWNKGMPIDKGIYKDDQLGTPDDDGHDDDSYLKSLAASLFTEAGMTEMEFSSNVFNEFLQIRQSSALFRLTTAADIIERVGFHNIGKRQTKNLIVMSIDDGADLADLDSANDAIVVVVNGSDQELSHTVATAAGFELHSIQQNSVDSTVASASFSAGENEGTFTVPALTVAIFVKPQGETQGVGLAATATAGAPDVAPYDDAEIFIRGSMTTNWDPRDQLVYQGKGIYQATIALTPGDYLFKVADSTWGSLIFGASGDAAVTIASDKTLAPGGDNLTITVTEDTLYIFALDASDPENPVLNVRYEEPYFGSTVYLRGDMNGWGTDNPLTYLGDGQYSVTFNTTEAKDHYFKFADFDWGPINIGGFAGNLEVSEGQTLDLSPGSSENMFMALAVDQYTFILDASNKAEPTLIAYSGEMFGDTTAFIRGEMNSWGEVDTLTYQGDGIYSVDISLAAGSYNFKVASGDWSTINLGGDVADLSVVIDTPYQLVQGSNDNLAITIAEAATYTFTVVGPNPNTATLTVTKQ
ncbi:MAG: alpha-1,6-glucosidase domain-containing protein [Thalassotalea sp.]